MVRALLAVLLLVVTSLVWPAASTAQAPDRVVGDRFDVDLTIEPSGAVLVRETQIIRFSGPPSTHGFREIPLDRVEEIKDVRVSEPGQPYRPGRNSPFTFTTERRDNTLRIDWWYPATSNAARTFILDYRAPGTIRVYPDNSQLRWNAVYSDRSYPVRASQVQVHFPGDVSTDQVRLAAYPDRLRADARLSDARTAVFTATDIPAGTGFEVRTQFPSGLIFAKPPAWQEGADRADWLNENLRPILNLFFGVSGLFIPILGFLLLFLLWYTRGRDPEVASAPLRLTAPPSDLPPALVGTLVDEHAEVHDVVAALVDLGNRGVIRITDQTSPGLLGLGAVHDYELELVEPDAKLLPHEKTIVEAIFHGTRSVRLSAVKDWFTAHIPVVAQQLYREVVDRGLFPDDPEHTRQRYRVLGIGLLVAGAVGFFFAVAIIAPFAELAFLPFGGVILVGAALVAVAGRMPYRTATGAREAARWRAFRHHLAELARHDGQTPAAAESFNRYLPYAVALGIDRTWVEKLARVGARPQWYEHAGSGPRMGGGPWGGPGPIIVPMPGPHYPGRQQRGEAPREPEQSAETGAGFGGPDQWAGDAGRSMDDWATDLGGFLDRVADILGHGGGSSWGGGGAGGGGGGGGGGSGGGSGGFD